MGLPAWKHAWQMLIENRIKKETKTQIVVLRRFFNRKETKETFRRLEGLSDKFVGKYNFAI